MISAHRAHRRRVTRFRTKLLVAIMLVVSAIMAFGLYLAQRNVTAAAQRDLQQNFQAELSSLDKVKELKVLLQIALRCRRNVALSKVKPKGHYRRDNQHYRDQQFGPEPCHPASVRPVCGDHGKSMCK